VEVSGYLQQIGVAIYEKGLVPSLIEMAGSLMPLIEVGCIRDIEMTHELLKVGLKRLYYHMEMVGHKHKGKKPDLVNIKRTGEEFQELLPVVVGKEDILSSIAPTGNMIARIGILNPKRAGHGEMVSGRGGFVKNKDLTPFPQVF